MRMEPEKLTAKMHILDRAIGTLVFSPPRFLGVGQSEHTP